MLFDSHAHLNSRRFLGEEGEAWSRAVRADVTRAVIVGYDIESSVRAIELAEQHSGLFAAVGIHPHSSNETNARSMEKLERLATNPKVVAIGETGLDYYRNLQTVATQQASLISHLSLASKLGLPAIIHTREAFGDVLQCLEEFEGGGVLHCYTGGPSELGGFLERGLHISFSGVITYRSGSAVREALRMVPQDRLLIETDSPYLAPDPDRSKRNEPANLVRIAECAAGILGESFEVLAQRTARNAANLFGVEPAT